MVSEMLETRWGESPLTGVMVSATVDDIGCILGCAGMIRTLLRC